MSARAASRAAVPPPEAKASRRQILDCAARLFREQGYAAVSLRDIAAASGMKAGSLYHHFVSKEEIVAEMLNIGVQTVFGEVRRAIEAAGDVPAAHLIETAVRAHLRSIFEFGDYTGASIRIFGHVPARVRDATIGERDAYERYWVALLARGARLGDLRGDIDLTLLRLFLFGAMNWALEWYKPGRLDLDGIARQLGEIILHGAAPVRAPPANRRVRRTGQTAKP